MLIDSHCHLNFNDLYNDLPKYLQLMEDHGVKYALCVGTRPDNLDKIVNLADKNNNLFASVGIHPDEQMNDFELTKEFFAGYINHPKVVAIGETGLDYYMVGKDVDMRWQHERFILHIQVANEAKLPLIIHTRESIEDTLELMKEYRANSGVMHCFTENLSNAKRCLDLGFYISISGIVTFKNADIVKEVAKYVPLDRLLVETDSPFLAPVPFRGKTNHPGLTKYVAEYIANLRGISFDDLAHQTTQNFFNLFKKAQQCIS